MPRGDSDYSGLIQFAVIAAIVVISLLVTWVKRLLGGGQEKPASTPGSDPADAAAGSEPRTDEAYAPEPPRQPAQAAPPAQGAPQSLEDFFRQIQQRRTGAEAIPVARAVPVARPVPVAQPVRGPVRQARAVSAAVTVAGTADASAAFSSEAVSRARAAIAQARSAPQLTFQGLEEGSGAAAATAMSVGQLGGLGGQDLARAVLFAEVLGRPRSIDPYSGPPQAG